MSVRRVRAGAAVIALCAVQFVDVMGVTSAVTAVPAMTADLDAPAWSTGVLATTYAMFFGGFLILGARLGDRYGHRRVLLIGVTAFTATAVVGMSADEIVQLMVARALQGVAAALSVPSALHLLLRETSRERRGTVIAAWGASGAAAGALGFLMGGVLTASWGWRSIYWINLPVGAALLLVIIVSVSPLPAVARRPGLDVTGAALLVATIMAVVLGCSMIEQPDLRVIGVAGTVAGLLGSLAFRWQQRRTRDPLLPRRALHSANLRVGTAVSFVNTATTSSAGVLVALQLQRQEGADPAEAGLRLLPFSMAVILGSTIAGRRASHSNDRQVAALGLGAVAAGTFVLALAQGGLGGVLAGVVLAGIGLGIAAVAATRIGTDVPDDLTGSAGGVLNTGAQIGTAVGVAALVALAASLPDPAAGMVAAYCCAAGIAVTAAVVLLRHSCRQTGVGRRA